MTQTLSSDERALSAVIALAIANEQAAIRKTLWPRVFALAKAERCIGVAWSRSGQKIRREAPSDLVDCWRGEVLSLEWASRRQFGQVLRAVARLRAAGLNPVVLKGAPLSQRLYGDAFVRHSADIDLYLAASERAHGHRVLLRDGWRHIRGLGGAEGSYERRSGGMRFVLEVHSSLTDNNLLHHLCLPGPTNERVYIEGSEIPAHGGPSLPAYLATHLAKHTRAPLLWLVDFFHLWRGLTDSERAAAWQVAREARAGGYLAWCADRSSSLLAGGDRKFLSRCGGTSGLFSEPHAALLGAALAESPVDAFTVLRRWALDRLRSLGTPGSDGTQGNRLAWLDRLAMRFRVRGQACGAFSGPASSRRLCLPVSESLRLIREGLCMGGSLWLVARGSSMSPAIPSGAQVKIARPIDLDIGSVVLAEVSPGELLMHRVKALDGTSVILRGDALRRDDQRIAISQVVAVATHLRVDGKTLPIANRPRLSIRQIVRRTRAAFDHSMAHASRPQ